MRGKVKYVKREEWFKENSSDHWSSDVHAVRYTNTYAVLFNGDKVCIDEEDIRYYYGYSRITKSLISRLNDDLKYKRIEYDQDWDGDYSLDGSLSDYI